MKKIVILILMMIFVIEVFPQSYVLSEEAEKYWYYRDRLKYFVMPGTAPGQSLLFTARSSAEDNWDRTAYTTQIEQSSMMMGFFKNHLRL